jgi:hypothetical protein
MEKANNCINSVRLNMALSTLNVDDECNKCEITLNSFLVLCESEENVLNFSFYFSLPFFLLLHRKWTHSLLYTETLVAKYIF